MISIPETSFVTILWFVLALSYGIVTTFWLLTMQRALEAIPENPKFKPSYVWITFIPLFGLYWQFVVVKNVADGLSAEYIRRGIIPREGRPGYSVGFTANILLCCALIPSFGILIAIFSNISRIIHLFKIKNYTSELEEVIRVQMQYTQVPLPPIDFQQYTNPSMEEELMKNNPNRFMPPQTPEEIESRWKRK